MKVVVGADHRGSGLVAAVVDQLRVDGMETMVLGSADSRQTDYPDLAYPVARAVAKGEANLGVLVCGSGLGMSIAANKVRGVRAALVNDEVTARIARQHNDANVLCLAADLLAEAVVRRIVRSFLRTPFEGGRHERRIEKVRIIEQGGDPSHFAGTVTPEASSDGPTSPSTGHQPWRLVR